MLGEDAIFVLDNGKYSSMSKKFDAEICPPVEKKKGKEKGDKGAQVNLARVTALSKFIDVRLFGSVFAYSGVDTSFGIKGAVSIGWVKSLDVINVQTNQITKSVNGSEPKDDGGRSSDTMGTKSFVSGEVSYVAYLSVSQDLARRNGVKNSDIQHLVNELARLFEGDESAARPGGSHWVEKVIVWKHSNHKVCSSHKLFKSMGINALNGVYQSVSVAPVAGVEVFEIEGF